MILTLAATTPVAPIKPSICERTLAMDWDICCADCCVVLATPRSSLLACRPSTFTRTDMSRKPRAARPIESIDRCASAAPVRLTGRLTPRKPRDARLNESIARSARTKPDVSTLNPRRAISAITKPYSAACFRVLVCGDFVGGHHGVVITRINEIVVKLSAHFLHCD